MPDWQEELRNAPRPLCRRRFLALLALTGAGAAAVSRPDLFTGAWGKVEEWLASIEIPMAGPPASESAYASFLGTLKLRNISVSTILSPHRNRRDGVQNTFPPEALWKNIIPTLAVVDKMAAELGEKVSINSAYRSPAYNAKCPGAASASQHLRNRALDIVFRSPPQAVAALAHELRSSGLFQGGIGVYPEFVHIDTRGRNADW
jgi:hypothetical protein